MSQSYIVPAYNVKIVLNSFEARWFRGEASLYSLGTLSVNLIPMHHGE